MITGLCSVCGRATKNPHSCISCGAVVCTEHYDFNSGFCPKCIRKLKQAGKSNPIGNVRFGRI